MQETTETTTTESTIEPTTHAVGETEPAELVVRYRYVHGVLLTGKTRPHLHEVKKAQPRWRWVSKLRHWGVPRTRGRVLSFDQVEEYAQGLRAAGVPNVRVDYQGPPREEALDLDEVETLRERALDRTGQLDEPGALLDRRKPLTAGDLVGWLPQSHRNAMALVDGVRGQHGHESDGGQHDADPYARALRDAGLHVPEPESVGERIARERARREQALVNRRADARALTEVRRVAASLGPVNPGRFNSAYRQLHPMFTSEEHRQRALVLTHEDRRIVATVRGPHGTEFSISRSSRTDERAVIAALLYRIEVVIPRSTGQPKARAVDPTPKDAKDTHELNVDEDALAPEPYAPAAAAGPAEPEEIVDMKRAIEELTRMIFREPKPEATDAAPGSEGQDDTGAVEDGHLAGEPVEAKERTIEDGSAGPRPRGEVEQEGVALAAGPGEGTGVHAPTEHPPPGLVSEPHPPVLELAERGARLPLPDTSALFITQASSEAPQSPADDEAPRTAGDQASRQSTGLSRPPTRRAATVHRADPWSGFRAWVSRPRDLGSSLHHARAPPHAREQGDGRARRARGPPRLRGYARMGPRNRGPPPHPR